MSKGLKKKTIMEFVENGEGTLRLNNISHLERVRTTYKAGDVAGEMSIYKEPVDILKIVFDKINNEDPSFSGEIVSREYEGVIEEACKYTEDFFADYSKRIVNELESGLSAWFGK